MSTQPRYDLTLNTAAEHAEYRAYWLGPVGMARWVGIAANTINADPDRRYMPKRLEALAMMAAAGGSGDHRIEAASAWVHERARLLLIECASWNVVTS